MQAFGVSLALLGAACLVAGLVGGAVKLANFELPALESRRVRVVLSLLGTVFFLFGVSVFLSSLGVPFGSTPAEGNPSAPNAEDDPTQHLDVETAFVGTLLGVGDVSDVAFSPDGKILATAGGNDHTVLLWNAANGEQIRILNGDCVADAVAFSTDGKLLAGACKLFDPATGEHIREMAGGYDLEFSPDGNFLAIANGYEPNGVRLYNPSTGELIRAVTTDYANSLAFSPDGTLLATTTGYLEKGVVLWKPATGQQVRTLSDGSDAVAFSPTASISPPAETEKYRCTIPPPASISATSVRITV